ncbi:MAG: hypothetical protein V1749_06210 [Candidatus Desantisbacteria bacterium]
MRFKAIEQLTNDQEQMQEIYEYLRSAKNELFNDNTPTSARILAWDLRTTEQHLNELCEKMLQDRDHYPYVNMIHFADRKFYRYIGNGD